MPVYIKQNESSFKSAINGEQFTNASQKIFVMIEVNHQLNVIFNITKKRKI